MSYESYRLIPSAIRALQDFRGNSVSGLMERVGCPACGVVKHYVVYSYSTKIFSHCLGCGQAYLTARKFSRTTSKIQNIIRGIYQAKDAEHAKSGYPIKPLILTGCYSI